jgi:hypothetical protein
LQQESRSCDSPTKRRLQTKQQTVKRSAAHQDKSYSLRGSFHVLQNQPSGLLGIHLGSPQQSIEQVSQLSSRVYRTRPSRHQWLMRELPDMLNQEMWHR